MSTFTNRFLTSLAAVCAATGGASAVETEQGAAALLRTATEAASRMTSCPASADDLVGEAALRILLRDRKAARNGSYVRRCLRNALIDDQRKRGRMRFLEEPEEDPETLAGTVESDLESATELDEFRAGLAPGERQVLDLLEEGHRDRAIAEETGRTRHDVRQSVARIREAAERYFGPEDQAAD